MNDLNELTWTCHICGKTRLDKYISIYKKPMMVNDIPVEQNVRYCNDNKECMEKSKFYNFLKKGE